MPPMSLIPRSTITSVAPGTDRTSSASRESALGPNGAAPATAASSRILLPPLPTLGTDSGLRARISLRARKSGHRVSRCPRRWANVLLKPCVIESPKATTAPARRGASTSMPSRNWSAVLAREKKAPDVLAVWSPGATRDPTSVPLVTFVVAGPVGPGAYMLSARP